MRKTLLAVTIMSFLAFAFCSKKEKVAAPGSAPDQPKNAAMTDRIDGADVNESDSAKAVTAPDSAQFFVKDCKYEPENPTASDDVTVTPSLKEGFSDDPSILSTVTFTYRWIVQNKEATEAQGNKLEKQYFKKKDWIQCRVRGFFNDKRTPEFRAKIISIQNSPPVLAPQNAATFNAPGKFTYQIKATDPDNDTLTYALIAPLDLGITLDAKSGLITWLVDAAQAKKNEPVEIKFSVDDGDGGKTDSSVTLSFSASKTGQ